MSTVDGAMRNRTSYVRPARTRLFASVLGLVSRLYLGTEVSLSAAPLKVVRSCRLRLRRIANPLDEIGCVGSTKASRHPLVGEYHGLSPVAKGPLAEDSADMGLHRLLADEQDCCDLAVRRVPCVENEHLVLTGREPIRCGARGMRAAARAGEPSIRRRVTERARSASLAATTRTAPSSLALPTDGDLRVIVSWGAECVPRLAITHPYATVRSMRRSLPSPAAVAYGLLEAPK